MTDYKPQPEICLWKLSCEDEKRMLEGRLRPCQLYCNGLQETCRDYQPINDFERVLGL